jgi:hypothetical protein
MTVTTETVTPDALGIDPRDDLTCGQRIRPDGAIAKSVPLKGTPRTAICEYPATHCIGDPRIMEHEVERLDLDTLEMATETRTERELALLSCGVHKERAVEHWQHFERAGDTGYPSVAEIMETENTDD